MKIFGSFQDLLLSFIVKSILSVCVLEASSFYITIVCAKFWTRIDFQIICDVTNHARRPTS